ncbi:cytochrome c [Pseudomonas sp. LD120]|uniref:cytochrome c n=1 Tax=Pseudomonas sp. LD120 TaxID=485751 RepID=UPI002113C589|nr:cytochrome c [Pseudomonas sp. LD120]
MDYIFAVLAHASLQTATALGRSNGPTRHGESFMYSTPDLTTSAFRKRLNDYPGVIVSSVILRPNGDLIPRTLQENGVKLPSHAWSVKDFRDLNQYVVGVISKSR